MGAPESSGAAGGPLAGLYGFVKTHLVVVNAVVVASASFVAAMDFLAPKLAVVPTLVYSATGAVVLLMLAAAFAPSLVERLLASLGFSARRDGRAVLWRGPAWQFSTAILIGITAIGFASVARASEGGLIAGRFPAAREWQESLLALSRNTADISRGVAAVNGKLDALVADSRDPQKDLVARGYSYDYSGLSNAIRQADVRAVRLFAQAGFKAQGQTPIVNLLNGPQPWSDEVASALPADMFGSPAACDDAGLLNYDLKPPVDRRMGLYKRLCGSAASIERLREKVASERHSVASNAYEARQREARRANLAFLSQ